MSTWQSVSSSKPAWTEDDVKACAKQCWSALLESERFAILSSEGDPIGDAQTDEITRQHLHMSNNWLLGVLRFDPAKAHSGFF